MYWFQKELKREINGITLSEWVKDHIEDKKYLRVYAGKENTYRRLDTFCSTKSISYGIIEKYKDNKVTTIELVDSDNRHDATLVFIEE